MAINSYGYPTLIAPGSVFSRMMQHAGHRYSVAGFSDFRVTISGSGTRRVSIDQGWARGKGVDVNNTAPTTLDLAAPSGTTQWFLVGLKRWAANPAYDEGAEPGTPESSPYISQLVSVAGTASRDVPTVTQTAGTDDTQWLALCRVISSATAVQEVVDLRLVSGEGGAGYTIYSDLALGALSGLIGSRVYRADTTGGHVPAFYERITDAAGVARWANLYELDAELTGTDATAVAGPSWARGASCRMVRDRKHRGMILEVTRTAGGAPFSSNSSGSTSDVLLAELHVEDRPPVDVPLVGRLVDVSDSNKNYGVFGQITPTGGVYITSMLPNLTVSPNDRIVMTAQWYRD